MASALMILRWKRKGTGNPKSAGRARERKKDGNRICTKINKL